MFYAVDEAGNRIEPSEGARAKCPVCEGEVYARCGDINVNHWAHQSREECDEWAESDTEWHKEWKESFPAEWVEQVVENDGERHVADVLHPNGTVIKLQHNRPDPDSIRQRENFFGAGNMLWLFDTRDAVERFVKWKEKEKYNEYSFTWKNARKRVAFPRGYVYLDLERRILQLKKMQIHPPFRGFGTLFQHSNFIDWVKDGAGRSGKSVSHIIGSRPDKSA